jgi:hypothetical protein
MKQISSVARGQMLRTNRSEASIPIAQSVVSICELLFSQRRLGTYQTLLTGLRDWAAARR